MVKVNIDGKRPSDRERELEELKALVREYFQAREEWNSGPSFESIEKLQAARQALRKAAQ